MNERRQKRLLEMRTRMNKVRKDGLSEKPEDPVAQRIVIKDQLQSFSVKPEFGRTSRPAKK